MKYLEQRVENLEKEVQELKIRLFQKNFEETKKIWMDTIYNPSITLMSEPDLETAFTAPFDVLDIERKPLNTTSFKATSNILSSNDIYTQRPPYPNIWSSWDDILDYSGSSDLPAYYPPANPEDVIGYESEMTCSKEPMILKRLSHEKK